MTATRHASFAPHVAADARLLMRHLLPNLAATAAILATQQAGAMILYESSLSFLGLGLGGSTVTWGGMAALGREAVFAAPTDHDVAQLRAAGVRYLYANSRAGEVSPELERFARLVQRMGPVSIYEL